MTKPKPKSQVEAVAEEIYEVFNQPYKNVVLQEFSRCRYRETYLSVARWHLRKVAELKRKRK